MSHNQDIKFELLLEKIELLKSSYIVVKSQNNNLRAENAEIKHQLEQKNNNISELETKYKNLQLAKAVSDTSGENSEARKDIEDIIREIDTCIALLKT